MKIDLEDFDYKEHIGKVLIVFCVFSFMGGFMLHAKMVGAKQDNDYAIQRFEQLLYFDRYEHGLDAFVATRLHENLSIRNIRQLYEMFTPYAHMLIKHEASKICGSLDTNTVSKKDDTDNGFVRTVE